MTTHRFKTFYIPEGMMPGIERYVEYGVRPGSFLTAIIENNLVQAVGQADEENMQNIPAFVDYFYNMAPLACWGSPAKMQAWVAAKKAGRTEDKEE